MESAARSRISCFPSAMRISFLLWFCFVLGLSYGKECTNVPTERVSHTLRSREIERGAVFDEVPATESRLREGESSEEILAMPKSDLVSSFRKFLTLNGWNGGGQRNEVRDDMPVEEEELTDDVLVDLDDWGQAWRTIAKPMLDKAARRADNWRGSRDRNDVLTLQLPVAEEIDGEYLRRRSLESSEEVVSRSESAVGGFLKDASLHKVK